MGTLSFGALQKNVMPSIDVIKNSDNLEQLLYSRIKDISITCLNPNCCKKN